MTRITITGGAGFIGSALVRRLRREQPSAEILLVDSFHPQIHGNVLAALPATEGTSWLVADVSFRATWQRIAQWQPDVIVHLAAETGTGQSMYLPSRHVEANILATAIMAEEVRLWPEAVRNKLRLVLSSSRAVYGEGAYRCTSCDWVGIPPTRSGKDLGAHIYEPRCAQCQGVETEAIPTKETHGTAPSSTYAWSKLMQEHLLAQLRGCVDSIATLRFQNVYGEGQSLKNPYTGILAVFFNLLRAGKPVEIFEDGEESRDFIHVDDICTGILATLRANTVNLAETVNLGTGVRTSVNELAFTIADYLGSSKALLKRSGISRVGDIRHCYADLTEARQTLKFTPQVTLPDGLSRFLDWAKAQHDQAESPASFAYSYAKSLEELNSAKLLLR